jgi:hypothetical protein
MDVELCIPHREEGSVGGTFGMEVYLTDRQKLPVKEWRTEVALALFSSRPSVVPLAVSCRKGDDCDSEREQRTWMPSQERLPSRDEENPIGSGFRRRGSAGDRAHRPLQEEPPRPEP